MTRKRNIFLTTAMAPVNHPLMGLPARQTFCGQGAWWLLLAMSGADAVLPLALAAWRRAVPGRMTEIQARGDYTVLLYEGDQMHTPSARATAIDIATATEDALAEHARRAAATG